MSIETISASFLSQVQADSDGQSWEVFLRTYEPTIHRRLKRHGVQSQDADDIVQEILTFVYRRIADFEHNGRQGAFRTWLRQIILNRVREFRRARRRGPDPVGSNLIQMVAEPVNRA